MEVGDYCSQLIDDGAYLQLGIGTIPDAVLSFLGGKYSRIVQRLNKGAFVISKEAIASFCASHVDSLLNR